MPNLAILSNTKDFWRHQSYEVPIGTILTESLMLGNRSTIESGAFDEFKVDTDTVKYKKLPKYMIRLWDSICKGHSLHYIRRIYLEDRISISVPRIRTVQEFSIWSNIDGKVSVEFVLITPDPFDIINISFSDKEKAPGQEGNVIKRYVSLESDMTHIMPDGRWKYSVSWALEGVFNINNISLLRYKTSRTSSNIKARRF
jgi:hypothetical protein